MVYFIIIRGPLGCGKSTIARRLAEVLRAVYFSVDAILQKHGLDDIDPEIDCIPVENFIKANRILLPFARKNLNSGKIVIFDACFYHEEAIEDLKNNLPYESFVFTLKAPLEVCIKRDRNRPKSHGKIAAEEVYKLVSKFDYGTNIDISKSLEEAISEIISFLPKH